MKDLQKTCKLALVQAAPVMFDKAACVDKAVGLIGECAAKGAEMIVFPELFIPGYPYAMTFGFSVGRRKEDGRKDWSQYYENSILVPGPETERLGEAARKAHAWLSIGVSERDPLSATLYNSNILFNPNGELCFCHRKLKPTGSERVVWGDANKQYFPVADTPWGPVRVKRAEGFGAAHAKPEFDDVAALAKAGSLPFDTVWKAALARL